ncbi:MAG: ATP-dependent DNA helicase RecG [Planctomycetota bacterium]|nr:MAG: ATP-dependent DNA helicase RecG [Planctomycetota bacterium]
METARLIQSSVKPATGYSRNSKSQPAASHRKAITSPLDKPVQYVRGVGPHRARLLASLDIRTVGEMIEYFPFRHAEQGRPQAIETLQLNEPATIVGIVDSVYKRGGFGKPTVNIKLSDGTGTMRATWFNASFISDKLARGQVLRLFGTVGEYDGLAQLNNPSIEWLDPDDDPATWDYSKIVPVYRATKGLPSQQIARLIDTALAEALPAIKETLPQSICDNRRLLSRTEAIEQMHHPSSMSNLTPSRHRLAYEEFFMMQLAISLQRRWSTTYAKAPKLPTNNRIDQRIRQRFPFNLTDAQNRVINDITADIAAERPMTRLLQGDVGSGKTVVALYAALVAVANHRQCAILAPTEVLAAQHFNNIEKYLEGSQVNRCLLTGKTPKAQRDKMLQAVVDGKMNLIVGTQALLEQKVRFTSLGLVIVDEQHKFGVSQRATLRGKGNDKSKSHAHLVPHYLVMTATPIPRTLSMTVFGDLDVSIIDELPPGRQTIHTQIIKPKDETGAWLEVRRRIADGDQAYIVYPLVEESDVFDLKAATVEVDRVKRNSLPGARVGLMHGRMKKNEKQKVMHEFTKGKLDALVSTTVIEVGIDVPNATIMVIQHADRYGLSALHQLRGRVGRGSKPSICLLMTDSKGAIAGQRLNILCETNDGFRIAEEDLRIRGPGELLGTRQHGWPEFRVANLVEDVDILMQARDDAAQIVHQDPGLKSPQHADLKAELRRRFRDKVAFIDVG